MARGDISIIELKNVSTREFVREDRTTSSATATVKIGEPIKQSADGANDSILLATGDPEIGTDLFQGIASGESTETSTVDGIVNAWVPFAGITVMQAKATTPANIDTAAERLAILNDCVAFDLTDGVFTIDEDEGNDNNVHGLVIVDVNIEHGTVDFVVKSQATAWGAAL